MQSVSLSSNQQKGQTVFQQLNALLREDYDNCKNLKPGETCYILAKKSIPFMIQYFYQESQENLTQIRKANAFLLQPQQHKDFIHSQKRFKSQVSHESEDETFKVKTICRRFYESLLKEIDLSGIAVERRAGKRGIDLHPLRFEVFLISSKSMKEIREEAKYSKYSSQQQIVLKKITINVYENESIGQILRRLSKIINKNVKEMRLYNYDDSLFQLCSFSNMIKYFLYQDDTLIAANEDQRKFFQLEENRISLDQDYLLEFFPGKQMRPENAFSMAQKESKYVLELKEDDWTFPEQPEFSIAEDCRFCRIKMQLYIMFVCQQCSKEFLFCSRVCHYQFLLQHLCKKASKQQIYLIYGEEYLV